MKLMGRLFHDKTEVLKDIFGCIHLKYYNKIFFKWENKNVYSFNQIMFEEILKELYKE